MTTVNQSLINMPKTYLFAEIARRVSEFSAANPSANLLRLGIGDVTRPLVPAVLSAMHAAVDEMGTAAGFRGYPPYEGYSFLRDDIAKYDYQQRGISISADEIFVSDGAKSDTSSFIEILGLENDIAVCDPVYPVYVDSNAMAGRAGEPDGEGRYRKLVYMPCTPQNGFVPLPPKKTADIIYLCYPNNPTGAVATRQQLKQWVDYANERQALILYDSAYEAYITEADIPRSIFEIEGARTCAVEFRSFSKNAGFTGTRCAYTVIPQTLCLNGHSLHALWMRRQSTKFNGVSYITQRGAQAIYTPEGAAQVRENIAYYLQNAATIRDGLRKAGLEVYGGTNAPYVWLKTPDNQLSWDFFDRLLTQAHVVGTPGVGFGSHGEGFFRLTGFGSQEVTQEAVSRITANL